MKLGTLLDVFDDWDKYIIINDNNLNCLYNARTKIFEFMYEKEKHKDLLGKEIVLFGLYNDDFCVRVK
jgi:hypothetical protein